ncbi:response regulator transcription factor [Oribacterium sp. NK2B42]|jgi:two-component system vancomycin resistance associated response regulator VraR|uniref:response regulator transcription factor n=1 Tax=Oribacterium sp. NK2B42 TaxID=689781 RepID=UPI0004182ADE|nr:response regulator transcription factor [Oribacterium sp. NK2B42]MBO6309586.1 response regulator transcription factor [Oribacterium sp.]MBP3803886.1 response regulator transcription factor [Oribacterium sp.]MBR1855575.1 response regulator transcription factor [Oribacterium sp.]HAG68605.1 DNA-binding response regulator [Lachnospiraceae bacterium]
MYKVLICDDQNISRRLFELFVSHSDRYEMVASIPSARAADTYCARFQVDLVLMDVVMKDGSDGLEAAARIKKNYPDTRVIIVTSMPEASYLERAKEIGADSFWYKELENEPLLEVMDRTMDGERVWPVAVPAVAIGMISSKDFTPSELMVLREVTRGSSNEEIAEALHLSVATVKTHINHMMQKTGFRNRTELAIEARVSGIVIP